jgi:hypothetical protein
MAGAEATGGEGGNIVIKNQTYEMIMGVNFDWNADSCLRGVSESYCTYTRGMAGRGCVRVENLGVSLESIARTIDGRLYLENEDGSPMVEAVNLYCVASPEEINDVKDNSYRVNSPRLYASRAAISVAGAGKSGAGELLKIQEELIKLFEKRKAASMAIADALGMDRGPLGSEKRH